jgi:FAD/FMN-containing dehydrogenase
MIDKTLALGGSFYLPYRLDYRGDQFLQAYPNMARLIQLKKQLDPQNLFTSQFFQTIAQFIAKETE